MLRSFLRLFSKPTPPQPIHVGATTVTIFAQVPPPVTRSSRMSRLANASIRSTTNSSSEVSQPESQTSLRPNGDDTEVTLPISAAYGGQNAKNQRRKSPSNHRQRVLSMKLSHTRICSARRAERLATMGIMTAGDMAFADPAVLCRNFKASRRALRVLSQYRRAIRLAASVPGMTPRDGMLMVSIHRRSVRGLAHETPGALYRDLERFAESTQGQTQLRGRRLPSTRRIKQWIMQCDAVRSCKPMQAQAA